MISKQLQEKLDYYEQVYYTFDEPIPFKEELYIYPVLVKDYYKFYNCLSILTMDKNVKLATDENGNVIVDEFGNTKKISNPKGIGQSYLAYLIDMMKDKQMGAIITQRVMQLFELVFHINQGMYCPHCHKEFSYENILEGIDEYVNQEKEKAVNLFNEAIEQQESLGNTITDKTIPKEILNKIIQQARINFLNSKMKCPECGEDLRDIFSIKTENGLDKLVIRDTEINSIEFDELKALIPRQNILDYDGDKYIDSDLKEELELKAKLQNQDYTSPTLEKQIICVSVDTGFDLEYLKNITMRKLSMMLRSIDKKHSYYALLQASMSGMVEFKEPPKHWIFSEDKKNIKDELTSLDNFTKKFDMVT